MAFVTCDCECHRMNGPKDLLDKSCELGSKGITSRELLFAFELIWERGGSGEACLNMFCCWLA